MTTRQVISELLQRMREEELRQVLDFARFLSSRAEREGWGSLALAQLERAYGPEESEYTEADLKPEGPARNPTSCF